MNSLFSILSTSDYFVFVAILALTIASIFWGKRRFSQTEKNDFVSYILMGRQLTLPLFVGTLVATWYGGIFGVTAIAYQKGIFNFLTQGLFWYGTYIFFALVILPRFQHSGVLTFPELVRQKFGPRAGKVAALFNFINVLPVTYTISIGIFISALLGTNHYLSMFIGVGFVCLYSAKSGFLSIVFTDFIQFFVMCGAVVLVLMFSWQEYGGLSFLEQSLAPHFFSLSADEGWLNTFIWGFIALATLIDPNFYQRCLAANSEKTAKKGILLATGIWCVFDICTTFGAMYAAAAMPGLDANQAYMTYALDLLPAGLRGFFLAGILATILSSLDSYLFIAANTVQYDFFNRHKFVASRQVWTVFAVGLSSILVAYLFQSDIKLIWKTVGSFFTGTLLLPVLTSFFVKRPLAEAQFLRCVAIAMSGMLTCQFFPLSINGVPIDAIYVGITLTSVLIFLHLIQTPEKSERIKRR